MGVALVGPEAGLEVAQDRLVQSGGVPGGIFVSHRQKVSPAGDAFSYFLSGRQGRMHNLKLPLRGAGVLAPRVAPHLLSLSQNTVYSLCLPAGEVRHFVVDQRKL